MSATFPIRAALDAADIDYVWHNVPGYGTSANPGRHGTNYRFAPAGTMIHYPVGIDDVAPDAILELILRGHAAAPKPIYHVYIDHAPGEAVHVISEGRANHAGNGWSGRLDDAKADRPPVRANPGDDTGGNGDWIGISLEGPPTTLAQRFRAAEVVAAIHRHADWTASRSIGHAEWSNRKQDPDFDMTWFRAEIAARLEVPVSEPLKPYEVEAIDRLTAEGIFTAFTTDEPGEVDRPVTVRKYAVFTDRLLDAMVESINAATNTGVYVTRDQVVSLIVDELTN